MRSRQLIAIVATALAVGVTAPAPPAFGAGPIVIVWLDVPGLLLRGQPAVLRVGADVERGSADLTFDIYARGGSSGRFTRLPLRGKRAPVPSRMLSGSFLDAYMVVHYVRSGRSITLPATGPKAPYRTWIVDAMPVVHLGSHPFGVHRGPGTVVVRASKGSNSSQVGMSCGPEGICFGPSSFDVARDGTVWVLDTLHDRLLGYAPGHPAAPSRTIQLAFAPIDLAIDHGGRFYLTAYGGATYNHLVALDPRGRRLWTHQILTMIYNDNIRVAADGIPYSVDAAAGLSWVPVASAEGRPLSLVQQQQGILPNQPLSEGGQLVIRYRGDYEQWVAIAGSSGSLEQSWRLESTDRMYDRIGTPMALGNDPVIAVDVPNPPNDRLETAIMHLSSAGGLQGRYFIPRGSPASMDGEVVTDLRLGPDGALYQLKADPEKGIEVVRYSTAHPSSPTPTPTATTTASPTATPRPADTTPVATSPAASSSPAPASGSSLAVRIAVASGGLVLAVGIVAAFLWRRRSLRSAGPGS